MDRDGRMTAAGGSGAALGALLATLVFTAGCAEVAAAAGGAAVPAGMAIAQSATAPSDPTQAKPDPAEATVGAADPYRGEVPKTVVGQPGPSAWPSPSAAPDTRGATCAACGRR